MPTLPTMFIEYYFAAGTLRLAQVIIYSSLWIVIGCFIAAIFRRMLGEEKVRRIFGNETRWGLVFGWLIGMLLPVCSLGVIPIVREMHRAGVNRGTIVAFGLTAPLFNPMSVLYGLTLSDPIAILSFSLCALVIVSLLGLIWDRLLNTGNDELETTQTPSVGIKRSVAVFYSACKEMVGPSLVYIVVGVLASVMLAALLPKGYLQSHVERDNLMAPVTVALVATPIYSTPLLAMSQIGGMFQHGNSIGAAFSLLILGAGINVGLLLWFGKTYGFGRVVVFFALLMGTTVGLAYVIDEPLYPKGVEPAGHSHAFDVYSNPFSPDQSGVFLAAQYKVTDFWNSNELGGTYLIGAMIIFGLVFSAIDRSFDFENWFVTENESKARLDKEVPGWVLGMTVVAGLIYASVMGCYLYYPPPEDLLGDLAAINTEAVVSAKTKDWEAAEKWIAYSDDLSRRLEVGVYLREGSVGEFQSQKARYYREELDALKAAVETRNTANIQELAMNVSKAYLRMSSSFRNRSGAKSQSTDGSNLDPEP